MAHPSRELEERLGAKARDIDVKESRDRKIHNPISRSTCLGTVPSVAVPVSQLASKRLSTNIKGLKPCSIIPLIIINTHTLSVCEKQFIISLSGPFSIPGFLESSITFLP